MFNRSISFLGAAIVFTMYHEEELLNRIQLSFLIYLMGLKISDKLTKKWNYWAIDWKQKCHEKKCFFLFAHAKLIAQWFLLSIVPSV